uniref:Uncharacterized protein n=1 Tax=Arundo donax TaxID=35708 RepID=A0A0A9GKL2_ARUDO
MPIGWTKIILPTWMAWPKLYIEYHVVTGLKQKYSIAQGIF